MDEGIRGMTLRSSERGHKSSERRRSRGPILTNRNNIELDLLQGNGVIVRIATRRVIASMGKK